MMPTEDREFFPRRTSHAIRMAENRARETPEQRFLRLEKSRLRIAAKRAAETPEQRYARLEEHRLRSRARRARETPEERSHRLEVARRSTARRRANETPEQTRARREMQRLRAAARRAAETPEEKQYRKKLEKERAAWRRACETPERRRHRLEVERLKNARKRARETPEERVQRLEVLRNVAAEKRAKETPQERLHRLAVARFRAAVKRSSGRPEKGFPLLEGLLRGDGTMIEREENAATPCVKPYNGNEGDMWMMCHNQEESVHRTMDDAEMRFDRILTLSKGYDKGNPEAPVYGDLMKSKYDVAVQVGNPQLGPEFPVKSEIVEYDEAAGRCKKDLMDLYSVKRDTEKDAKYGSRFEMEPPVPVVNPPPVGPIAESIDTRECFDTLATQFLEITQSEPDHVLSETSDAAHYHRVIPTPCTKSFEALRETQIRVQKLLANKACTAREMKLLQT